MSKPNRPVLGNFVPRFSGVPTFLRLPMLESAADVDIAVFGVPWDTSSTNRSGSRHAPRIVREMSGWMRLVHPTSRIQPYELCSVADLGDCPVNPLSIEKTAASVETFVAGLVSAGAAPLAVGGDHLVTLPVLRGLAPSKPLGLVHFDSHSDTTDVYFEDKINHATTFRRAIEEGLVDPKRTIQIGIRGSTYDLKPDQWARDAGVRIVTIDEMYDLGFAGTEQEIKRVVGSDPAFVSFDIDSVDPAFAPGTGTPEIGGFTSREAQLLIRGLKGLNVVGADMVEISPPWDSQQMTSLLGATLLFELLCIMAEAKATSRK
jgi:guanidinopropionase